MDDLKRKWRNLPLRTFFMFTVLSCFCAVFLVSGLIVWGCFAFRNYLLPDSDYVYLSVQETYEDGRESIQSYRIKFNDTPIQLSRVVAEKDSGDSTIETLVSSPEYSPRYAIEKIEPSYNMLTPKRKLAYTVCGIAMVAAPAALSLAGIILCSFYFYRRKLKQPLELLSDATVQIAAQNLDFRPEYDCGDEMGGLCRSFVQMQDALYESNREMWAMLEERKRLQASVSHDLRNPIAIIQGYAEHLENKAEKGDLPPENALRIARNISLAAKRMENYACSLHALNQLEDITAQKAEISALRLAGDLAEDFSLMARQNCRNLYVSFGGARFRVPAGNPACAGDGPASEAPLQTEDIADGALPDISVRADSALVYRVLENIMGNALRFSRKDIFLCFTLEAGLLSVTVRDDGAGFSEKTLENSGKTFFSAGFSSGGENHMGIGIPVSRILCRKHGGELILSNSPLGGARVEILLDVS